MKKPIIRFSVIVFWVGLIFFALYWPKWKIFHYEANSINIFAWGDILEPSVIADFEKETGIKVYLNYYSSNEELLVKLKATRGEGYDLIVPSDYAVSFLIQEQLLKKLDKSKLHFMPEINPLLLGHFFDPENAYSIPFEWEIFGFGVNQNFFTENKLEASWKLAFAPPSPPYKITTINDPIESILLAAYFLYGSVDSLNPSQTEAVKNLLFRQKKWVEAYADFRGDYFLVTKNCPIVVALSSYIIRSKKIFNFIDFVVPKEGTFLSLENLCIPAASDKDDLVYRLMNYLYRPESIKKHFNTYGFFPATLPHIGELDIDEGIKELIKSSVESFKKYHFTKVLLPQNQIQNIWVQLKSDN